MDFWGSPGTTNVIQTRGTAGTKPPGFDFAKWLSSQLPGLMNSPFPTYQGNLDPGLSPTMQDVIRRAQGYAQSSAPEILAGAQGSLGRFMNPTFLNPWNRLFGGGNFGGAPNYMGVDPNQRVYGGGTAQDMTYHGGGSPPMSAPMSVNAGGAGGGMNAPGASGGIFAGTAPPSSRPPEFSPFPPAPVGGGGRSLAGTAHGGQAGTINTSVNPWAGGAFNRDAMAGRYGANWSAGAPGLHSTSYAQMLREELGREPTALEVNDAYYSQDPGLVQRNRIRSFGSLENADRALQEGIALAERRASPRGRTQPGPAVPVPNMPTPEVRQ